MKRFAILLSLLLAACNEIDLVPTHGGAPGAPVPDEEWNDLFQQAPAGSSVDVLWVVDNSGSMQDEQEKLAANFEAFISHFVTLELDFRLAVVTTDVFDAAHRGRIRGGVLEPTTPDLADRFLQNVLVGTNGSGREQGLEAARLALSPSMLAGPNAGFLREDALLSVIIVSDEEDQSRWSDAGGVECAPADGHCTPVSEYVSFLRGVKPVQSKLHLSLIMGPAPTGCSTSSADADAGLRYAEAASLIVGSTTESICAPDFGPALDHLGHVIASQAAASFGLTYAPTSEVEVFVDGVRIAESPTTWRFDAATTSVVFADGAVPVACSEVSIHYAHAAGAEPATTSQGPHPECPIGAPEGPIDWRGDAGNGGGCSIATADRNAPLAALLLLALLARRRR